MSDPKAPLPSEEQAAQQAADDAWEAIKRGSTANDATSSTSIRDEWEAAEPAADAQDWDALRDEHFRQTRERDDFVRFEVQKLMVLSGVLGAAMLLVTFVLGKLGWEFFANFTPGFGIGATLATVNLGVMAKATYGFFNGEKGSAAFAFAMSIALLLGGAVWVATNHSTWLFGYCVGIALPAMSGVWYAKRAVQGLD